MSRPWNNFGEYMQVVEPIVARRISFDARAMGYSPARRCRLMGQSFFAFTNAIEELGALLTPANGNASTQKDRTKVMDVVLDVIKNGECLLLHDRRFADTSSGLDFIARKRFAKDGPQSLEDSRFYRRTGKFCEAAFALKTEINIQWKCGEDFLLEIVELPADLKNDSI